MVSVGDLIAMSKTFDLLIRLVSDEAIRSLDLPPGSLGLDAIGGTPVFDIKPYYPVYDRVAGAVVPARVDELMKGCF